MTPTEIRQKLHHQIDQLPADLLLLVAEFLEFLKFRLSKGTAETAVPTVDEPVNPPTEPIGASTGADLIPFVGTWQGDDIEDCLQAVYETRSPAEF
jgi:hypothetical protein